MPSLTAIHEAGSAAVGDVIGYDWGGDDVIDHVAVVTTATSTGVSVTQRSAAQQDRPWAVSWVTNTPLKVTYPDAKAWLLHVTM